MSPRCRDVLSLFAQEEARCRLMRTHPSITGRGLQ
jgi:hypothetical protein